MIWVKKRCGGYRKTLSKVVVLNQKASHQTIKYNKCAFSINFPRSHFVDQWILGSQSLFFQWILVTKKGFHVWYGRRVGLNCFSTSLLNLSWRSDRFLPGFLFRHSFFQSKYQPLKTTPHPKQLRPTNQQKSWNRFFWANYSDLSRGHPKWWYTKGIPPQNALKSGFEL